MVANGSRPRRGREMGDVGVLKRADVLIDGGKIAAVRDRQSDAGTTTAPHGRVSDHVIDAAGSVLMPAFVDCHTHACWAGDRLDEWELRLRGASYLDILKSGGGI